jgi:serine/threonine protein kinase
MDKFIEKFKEIDRFLATVPVTGDYTGVLVLASLGLVLLLILLILSKRRSAPQAEEEDREEPETITEDVLEPMEEEAEITQDDIVAFFLRIYKVQLGEPKEAKAKFITLESEGGRTTKTYELQVFHNKQWVSRRMTAGLAGDDSASRSKCFHVIYDDHFVIKIPQRSITNFTAYISAIESDHRIVRRVSPLECIVPTVSAVMRMIHPFSDGKQLSPDELEDKYLNWLRKYPSFQGHLKIGSYYIFVMDLSRYFFLSHLINDVHDLSNKVYQEIVGYPDVIWENHGFEGRYAEENDEEIDAVRTVFKTFEERSERLLKKAGKHKLPRFTLQKWFLIHLAGRELAAGEKDLKPEAAEKINGLLRKTFSENEDIVNSYRKTIRGCVQAVTVSQNNHQIAGLVTNLLDLVAFLRAKGVAMRDMKPDNLLIAGDKARYPEFLDAITDYSVGLIDVETAVAYSLAESDQVPQPILGGTPNYATPAHLVFNTALAGCFQNVPRILHLQDLHAAVAIAYEIITGEKLYDQTGKLIIGIKQLMFKNMDNVAAQIELFENASRMFWHSAQAEMTKKFKEKEDVLKMVKIDLSDSIQAMLEQELQDEKETLSHRIVSIVDRQKVLTNAKIRRALIGATHKKISQLKEKWQATHQKGSTQGLKLLSILETLKIASERNEQLIKLFAKPSLTLSVHELLLIMFDIVRKGMCREDWGDLVAAEVVGVNAGKGATTVESTV